MELDRTASHIAFNLWQLLLHVFKVSESVDVLILEVMKVGSGEW